MHPDAERRIAELELAPHPEGGFYREVHRSEQLLALPRGTRATLTAIHYLLPGGDFSAFHRVGSDEVWCFQEGDPLDLQLLTDDGGQRTLRLGRDAAGGSEALVAVPAGTWQAAESRGARYSWCSCLVAPGFDFADFELGRRAQLERSHPRCAELVRRLTR